MPHDYKNHLKSKPKSKATRSSAWVWLLVGMLAGAFLMGLAWLKLSASKPEPRWIGATPDRPPQQVKPAPEPTPVVRHTPSFEFFNKLPKQEVLVTEQPLELRATRETDKVDEADSQAIKSKPQSGVYYLQIASFSKPQDAERLRAELALLGMETHINSAQLGASQRYRVIIGPFVDTTDLHATQKQLRQHGHTKLLVVTKNAR